MMVLVRVVPAMDPPGLDLVHEKGYHMLERGFQPIDWDVLGGSGCLRTQGGWVCGYQPL